MFNMFGMIAMNYMSGLPPKGKLIESLITPEIQDIFDRKNIDPHKYVVHSGLLQIGNIEKDFKLSKKDKITLSKWSLDTLRKLYDAEVLVIDTLNKLFSENPVMESHRMNFPILTMSDYILEERKKSIKNEEDRLSFLKQKTTSIK